MSFVIKRKADGSYAKGRQRWLAEWVNDIQKARIYPTRGNATTSLRHTFNSPGRYYRKEPIEPESAFEIIPVRIVEDVS